MNIRLNLCAIVFLVLTHTACTLKDVSSEYSIKKGTILILEEPYYFVDNPGRNTLMPVKGYSDFLNPPPAKTLLPVGTKIKYLNTKEYDALMLPKPNRTAYGKILGHEALGRVAIDSLILRQTVN